MRHQLDNYQLRKPLTLFGVTDSFESGRQIHPWLPFCVKTAALKVLPSPSAGEWEPSKGKMLAVTLLLPQVAQKRGGRSGDPGHGRQSPVPFTIPIRFRRG